MLDFIEQYLTAIPWRAQRKATAIKLVFNSLNRLISWHDSGYRLTLIDKTPPQHHSLKLQEISFNYLNKTFDIIMWTRRIRVLNYWYVIYISNGRNFWKMIQSSHSRWIIVVVRYVNWSVVNFITCIGLKPVLLH